MKLNSKPKAALILSAGFGKRLKPITDHTPKALVEINGTPALKITIDKLIELGFKRIFVNTHYLAEKIHLFIEQNFSGQVIISYEKEILETGGGILKVFKDYKLSHVLIINCDAFFLDLKKVINELINKWDSERMDFLVALKKVDSNGDFNLTSNNNLSRKGDLFNYRFTGLYIIKPEILKKVKLEKFSVTSDFIFKEIEREENKFFGYVTDEYWIDIGTPQTLDMANKLFKNNLINK